MNRSDSTLVMQHSNPTRPVSPNEKAPAPSAHEPPAATRSHSSASSAPACTPATDAEAEHCAEQENAVQRWMCEAPWRSKSGWARWLADDIPVHNAVPNLVMQAFATGYVFDHVYPL